MHRVPSEYWAAMRERITGDKGQAVLRRISRPAWALLLFALPVTSFPYFPPALGGEALVRPLSIYPLLVLLVISVLPRLFTRPISRTVLSLLPFVLVAATSSILSLLQGIEPALGISVESRVLRGFITLLIGCSFYVTVAQLPDTLDDLRYSLRWIYAGGAVAMLWGSVQSVALVLQNPPLFYYLTRIQEHISIRPLRIDRISGLTYEPHWFAEQIILLLLPWALAAVFTNTSAFDRRWGRLTVETGLVVWAILMLPFTFSRAGLANLVVLIFLSLLIFRPLPAGALNLAGASNHDGMVKRLLRSPALRRRGIEVILVTLAVIAPIYLIGTRNLFFARIWEYWQQPNASLTGYLTYLGMDARLVYSQAAYRTYESHPVLGVGLGNYAFYFEEMLPYRPIYEVPEVLMMVTPEPGRDRLITAKNFYLRVLAETGIVGGAAFMAFLVANLGNALYLWLSPRREEQVWGMASLCGLLAFFLAAFTFDSFVIPNMWVVLGLITAATRVIIHTSCKGTVESEPVGILSTTE